MSRPDFLDASTKLARARKHIRDVELHVTSFLATDFYRLIVEPHHGNTIASVRFESFHQIDKKINTEIGDAISNLRSALDYLVVAILSSKTGIRDKGGFPFAETENDLSARIRKCIPEPFLTAFLDEVKTYKSGPGHDLWVLNNLRNIDKHRLLLTTINVAGFKADFRVGTQFFYDFYIGIQAGTNSNVIRAPAGQFDFTNQPSATFSLEFDEPPYISNVSVVEFLNRTAEQTQILLNLLQKVE